MARISKTDHPRILHLVDVDRRKVVEVAAEYGCTPANIYALLGKMRRARADGETADSKATGRVLAEASSDDQQHEPPGSTALLLGSADPSDLFAGPSAEMPSPSTREAPSAAEMRAPARGVEAHVTTEATTAVTAPSSGNDEQMQMALAATSTGKPTPSSVVITDLPKKGASRAGIGNALAKTGYGLAMRTADGDENITPFRSLDDLLSAIKPILRSAARSSDPMWFSIQPIDLAMLEVDAA